ncbi:hypothetical protein ACHAWT_006765 [Skeletonema menzelii]|mmetsp:Transcript_26161/g.42529  ORF Transcript_26161/g.42529 Transcript_26161/m.42529 type:complete len:463 (+) Transcript_26161:344-1732(+)|eukprot:scaffold25564_cov137-Skeletonema_menzelii.AAC.3
MSDALAGIDIGRVMSSDGPIVKCVLLRTQASSPSEANVNDMSIRDMKRELESLGVDTSQFVEKPDMQNALTEARMNSKKPASNNEDGGNDKYIFRGESVPLLRYMEEIEVDTTPKKSMVAQVLGGDFTFLGQYEDEGIMVMVRRPDWEDEDSSFDESDIPPVNPHPLQPPFDEVEVRGDILLIRVAETAEELDDDDDDEKNDHDDEEDEEEENDEESKKQGEVVTDLKPAAVGEKESHEEKQVSVPANDDFFLDYSMEEYLKFASRTDVEGPPILEESDESAEEDDEGEAGESKDEDYDPEVDELSDEEYDDEEHQVGMMNLILGQILRKFHEENGRGPDTLELLEMRKALADRLGVEVPPVDEEACDWDKKAPTPKKPTPKKVVVAEEKNECETFPREVNNLFASENDEEAAGEQDDSSGLKRSVEMIYGEQGEEDDADIQHQSKKANLCKESGKEGEVAA